jgi:hypothetical protein
MAIRRDRRVIGSTRAHARDKFNYKHSNCVCPDPCFVGQVDHDLNDVYVVNVGAKPRTFVTLTNRRYEDE